jgi:excinuclease ABC subunit C
MPSLIVVDGGQAQINAAQRFQERVGLMIPVVSVVKDERHRPRAVMGDKTAARQHESAILLANSEAHRFAITFHKKKRAKDFLK